LLPLLLLGLLGLVAVAAAVSAGAPPPAWGPAIEVPGTAALNRGGAADVTTVSCAAAGGCAAGGFYFDAFGGQEAFVVDETDGSWGTATEVPGTAILNNGGAAQVSSVSCATAGNCTAGGTYADDQHFIHAFLVDETNGTWGNAFDVPGMATLNSGDAKVNWVSCPTAGDCTAGGFYHDSLHHPQAFVVDETNGSWGNAVEVPGTAALNVGGAAVVNSVSCATAGNCSAAGSYRDGSDHSQAFVSDETNGTWSTAIEVPGTAALNGNGPAAVRTVSCAATGDCSAGGYYTDGSSNLQAFVVDETNGIWGTATEVPGTDALNAGGSGRLVSVSCAAAGNCSGGGYYVDGYGSEQAFVVDETNGTWGTAIEVPGTAALNKRGNAKLNSVSCGSAGNCAAGGAYSGRFGQLQTFVVNETNGTWRPAIEIPGTAVLNSGGLAWVNYSVSCATAGSCAVGGFYTDRRGHQQAFVAGSAAPVPLSASETICNGAYTGTGDRVTVPGGDTCVLATGTRVTHNVTVSYGGTLYATGVKIGGALKIAGSATVCQSSIRGNVKAVSVEGSLELGGRSCVRGNVFSGNVVVKRNGNDLWIGDNKIAGNLVVYNSHGATDSIVGNRVANLLVAHSGPVVVIDNHAKGTSRCIANRHQHGHGNTARRLNTCPK